MSRALQRWVTAQWQVRGVLAWILRPLAWLAQWHVLRKQAAYRSGRRQAHHPGVPVIVVGNIYVGGTGKTPVVIAVTRHLQSRGFRPGIVSRGYGVKPGARARTGHQDVTAESFGDEPTLINRQTGVPIGVHPSRVAAAKALLAAYPEVDVLVSDDGLQHLALARDVEILVQDGRGIGNGLMLPAGPLREPAGRREVVDAVITNLRFEPVAAHPIAQRASGGLDDASMRTLPGRPAQVVMRTIAGQTHQVHGTGLRSLTDWAAISTTSRIVAVAAIGQPQLFFDLLRQAGICLSETHAWPDHQAFDDSTFQRIQADVILMTSKDAVKCDALVDLRLWEVPIEADFDPVDFLEHIIPFHPRTRHPRDGSD